MAGLTKAQRAEREAQHEAQETPTDDGLIAMSKDGETMRVHPSCVTAHVSLGWQVKEN